MGRSSCVGAGACGRHTRRPVHSSSAAFRLRRSYRHPCGDEGALLLQLMAASAPRVPDAVAATPKYCIIGGTGVELEVTAARFSWDTPFGEVTNLAFLDAGERVIFVNRHSCTEIATDGEAKYAPPHVINTRALVWALKEIGVQAICAIGSTGTLRPIDVPVGSIVMPDDFLCVVPNSVTFWPHEKMAAFTADAAKGEVGRIHFAPAILDDEEWVSFREFVRATLCAQLPSLNQALADAAAAAADEAPVATAAAPPAPTAISLGSGQDSENWPAMRCGRPSAQPEMVYVQTTGPRFETRAEIASYVPRGHVVGMTCASEWILASELMLPYALVCAVDNCCNGLSSGDPVQEYIQHKNQIKTTTAQLIRALTEAFSHRAELDSLRKACAGE